MLCRHQMSKRRQEEDCATCRVYISQLVGLRQDVRVQQERLENLSKLLKKEEDKNQGLGEEKTVLQNLLIRERRALREAQGERQEIIEAFFLEPETVDEAKHDDGPSKKKSEPGREEECSASSAVHSHGGENAGVLPDRSGDERHQCDGTTTARTKQRARPPGANQRRRG